MQAKFLHFPYGPPVALGQLKTRSEDFQVQEVLSFEPCGSGEHYYLYLKKKGMNTEFLAKKLQDIAGVTDVSIGYAGRKDRHAVTMQWFSVQSHESIAWESKINELSQQLASDTEGRESVELLLATRHSRKLRKGEVQVNHFKILVRQVKGKGIHFESDLKDRLQLISQKGFLNYFGDQRFQSLASLLGYQAVNYQSGHDELILSDSELDELLSSYFKSKLSRRRRGRKGFDLSIARSYLFNKMLSDCADLASPGSATLHPDEQMPLVGESRDYQWENSLYQSTIERYPKLVQLICSQRIQLGWRQAYVRPTDFSYHFLSDDQLELVFSLPSGSYATVLVAHFLEGAPISGAVPKREMPHSYEKEV